MLKIAVNNTKTTDSEIRQLAKYLRAKWEEKNNLLTDKKNNHDHHSNRNKRSQKGN